MVPEEVIDPAKVGFVPASMEKFPAPALKRSSVALFVVIDPSGAEKVTLPDPLLAVKSPVAFVVILPVVEVQVVGLV